MIYRGRFAPSPTGPLHFGSLFAACISYIEAKHNNGQWLVRIEDVDPPREDAKAKDLIITCLTRHGLIPDESISFQSNHSSRYENLLEKLASKDLSYRCPCSRKELEAQGHSEQCQKGELGHQPYAIKFKSNSDKYFKWEDLFLGSQEMAVANDFVLKRKDLLYAYQLAVVADDMAQNITHVVRGIDLLESTPMQLAIYEAAEAPAPVFGHFPVLTGSNGQKLSKQNLAMPVNDDCATNNLRMIAELIGIPLSAKALTPSDILDEMHSKWANKVFQSSYQIPAPQNYGNELI